MDEKVKKKVMWYSMLTLVGLLTLYIIKIQQQKSAEDINTNGVSTIAIAIKKARIKARTASVYPYIVKFDFYVNGKYVVGSQSVSEKAFQKVIVGMAYQARYLPSSPHVSPILYVDMPIDSLYGNIPQERIRIKKMYDYRNRFINDPPLDEIPYFQLMKD